MSEKHWLMMKEVAFEIKRLLKNAEKSSKNKPPKIGRKGRVMKLNIHFFLVIAYSFIGGICIDRGYLLAFVINASAVIINALAIKAAKDRQKGAGYEIQQRKVTSNY